MTDVAGGASGIDEIVGRALPLRGHDIDTDRIMPARYLKAVSFAGLEAHVFADDRAAAARTGRPHAFDDPRFSGARVLLAHANFGCGSSREHAPQALQRWGIRAIVAESFAEIFFSNAVALGLPCLTASPADVERLMVLADRDAETRFTVSVSRGAVEAAGSTVVLEMPASARHALVTGEWDATGLLLANYEAVERVAERLTYLRGD